MNQPIENTVVMTEQLGCRFGKQWAVDGLDLSVKKGVIYALLGQNGAGKTTTLRMLANIIKPTRGRAEILGTSSVRLGPEAFRRIGYVSENQELPDWMTVRQLIDYCRPLYPTWDDAFCDKLLSDFELPLDRKLKKLSRGMRMKASLISSIAYRPDLLILDEPFSGLDPMVRDDFIRGILELTEQENWTILISSHDIEEVEKLADEVGILHEGRLRFHESLERLQERFRMVECQVESHAAETNDWPDTWIQRKQEGRLLRFAITDFDVDSYEAAVLKVLPESREITARTMTLREIFIVLMRHFRIDAVNVNSHTNSL